jgi:trimeric autotransporter adhesin
MKKKAIKIAAASAVAASAFVAAAPLQSNAASNVTTTVDNAVKQMQVAYHTYSDVTANGQFADINSVYKELNAAKVAYTSAKALVVKAGGAQKDANLAKLDDNYNTYITKRVVTYVDAYNYAIKNLKANKEALKTAIDAKNLVDVQKYYNEISYQLNSRTVILDRVYGQTTRELLRSSYKADAQALRDTMKYDVTVAVKAKAVTDAITAGKLDVAKAAVDQINLYLPKVSETFKADLTTKATAAVAAYEATQTPAVVSVSAINGKQLVVTFNKAMQTGLATGGAQVVTGYSLNSVNPTRVELSADAKTATLTFGAGFVASLDKYVEFKAENIKDASGKDVTKYQAPLFLQDKVVPTASVSFSAPVATVNFSEPLNLATATVSLNGVAKVAGTDYTVTQDSATDAVKGAVKLTFSGLTEGTYKIAIVGAKDLAGNFLPDTVLTVTVAADNVAPEVTSMVAEGSNVRVTFSEPVDQAVLKDGAATVATVTAANSVDAEGKVFVLDASSLIVAPTTFVTKELTVAAGSKDASNNASKDYKKTLTVTLDKTAPKVVSTTVKDDKIIVKFDEAIQAGATPIVAATGVSTSFTTADGIVQPTANKVLDSVAYVYDANNDGDTTDAGENQYLVLDATSVLAAGDYKVVIPADAVKDAGGNNIVAATLSFKVASVTNANETLDVVPSQVAPGVLQFIFDAELTDAMLNPNFFTINGSAVPAGSKIYFYGDKTTVRIELPEGTVSVDGNRTLAVKDIKDKNNNTLTTAAKTGVLVPLKENVKILAEKVTLLNSKQITVSFVEDLNSTLTGATLTGIKVKKNGVAIDSADVAFSISGKVVTVTTTSASFDLTDAITVEFTSSNVADENGNTIKDVVISK